MLVTFAVVGRVLQIDLVFNRMCYFELFRGTAPSSATVSMVEWIMIIAILCGAVQLVLMIDGLFSRSGARLIALLGAINIVFAISLFTVWAQVWALWHPDEAFGRWVSQTTWSFGSGPQLMELGEIEFRHNNHEVEIWQPLDEMQNGKPVYRHRSTGVTKAYELIGACFPPEILRANMRMAIEARGWREDAYDPDMTDNRYGWIYRDRNGALMSGPYFRSDRIGMAYRNEAAQAKPKLSYEEFVNILTEEEDELYRTEDREDMSLEDFTNRYLCIRENQRTGEVTACY